ncbi:MAG: adenosylcobinamide-GDP ribazoletransferase [Euryarchaeota archaeon]|nr:adenosylcobinamide-GDP ribazoletransferase [Euryarchaeota archaeon]MBV1729676.1 adenosylcobinamide-GDP ribazoletransferase [Methanobacterium sp.]MBU4548299.1 adenosylcobinamide-GDP ribazoletransferase [Euryarchaeota archaeon]MBU4607509.1 adenosylcobinamide-GDP ribazoletransferase [Euryarchaeota archaeon]MBV1754449.1 adenosylcobinamide-GDP ribazoletransferase [Methanobacterium sp.]
MSAPNNKPVTLKKSSITDNHLKKTSWYISIAGLISFSTVIPLNIHISIKDMAGYTWMWPLIGGLLGVLVGLVGLILQNILLPPLIIATIVYSFALYFTGFHHLDGLIDMGDALMAHGTPARKIEIMRDPRIGTGGISIFFIVAAITVATIASLPPVNLFYALFISEIGAKLGLVSCCTLSSPEDHGTGKYFIKAMNPYLMSIIVIISLLIGFLLLKSVGVAGIIGSVLAGIYVALMARKHFKTATGDVLGAANEISRMVSFLSMLIAFMWIG